MYSRRARLEVRLLDAERRSILVHRSDEARGQRLDRLACSPAARLMILSSMSVMLRTYVTSKPDARSQRVHHVEHDHDARVAEMAVVVHGHPADVHAHLAGHDRLELCLSRVSVL